MITVSSPESRPGSGEPGRASREGDRGSVHIWAGGPNNKLNTRAGQAGGRVFGLLFGAPAGVRLHWLAAMTGCVVGREQHANDAIVLPLVVRAVPSCFCLQGLDPFAWHVPWFREIVHPSILCCCCVQTGIFVFSQSPA